MKALSGRQASGGCGKSVSVAKGKGDMSRVRSRSQGKEDLGQDLRSYVWAAFSVLASAQNMISKHQMALDTMPLILRE